VKSILRRRPSPALVVSCVALFLSLGGVSYGLASGSIDSRELKNNTIRSKDVRNNTLRTFDIRNNEIRGFDIRSSTIQGRDVAFNTLTGADISEQDLAKVPSAAAADTAANAANAANAGTVGGMSIQKFFAKPAPGTALTEVFRSATFVLRAGCAANGDALLVADPVAGAPATNLANNVAATQLNTMTLAANTNLIDAATSANGTAIVSTTAGSVATVVYAAQEANGFSGENVCAIRGTVTSG
jgi:hypothetical protein